MSICRSVVQTQARHLFTRNGFKGLPHLHPGSRGQSGNHCRIFTAFLLWPLIIQKAPPQVCRAGYHSSAAYRMLLRSCVAASKHVPCPHSNFAPLNGVLHRVVGHAVVGRDGFNRIAELPLKITLAGWTTPQTDYGALHNDRKEERHR